jgi:hypothetical protein
VSLGGQSRVKPTAFGTLMQASTYGMTIPTIHGTTQSNLLAIWAANLRQGKCLGKKGKSGGLKKKKTPPSYVENIDFLIGSNPIDGILQAWSNSKRYPLNFVSQRFNAGGASSLTITDAQFYAVIAVTMELDLSGTFNDYGSPGPSAYSLTASEYSLWNMAQHGPDLINSGSSRFFPFLYKWVPADLNVVTLLPAACLGRLALLGAPWNGFMNVYYAQLSQDIHHKSPISRFCLEFEPVLGDGDEFTGNFRGTSTPLSTQQILYPEYAGAGSPDIDLGTSETLPLIQVEVRGSNARYAPRGDADFVDMIEDTVKSGLLQVGAQLGLIQRGVNLNDLPGAVQKAFVQFIDPAIPVLRFDQANAVGDQLVAIGRFRYDATGGAPNVADVAGNTWVPVYGNNNEGIWTATAVAAPAGNEVTFTDDHGGSNFNADAFIVEMDPGSSVLDNSKVVSGTTPAGPASTVSASIAVTGEPTYILAVVFADTPVLPFTPPALWTNLFPQTNPPLNQTFLAYRIVAKDGAYSFTMKIDGGVNWTIALLAFKSAQPVPYPKALGNILDSDSLELTRTQCRANGLWGSVTMNQQKKAGDWIEEFLTCANAVAVWSGDVLKIRPRSEVSVAGNGVVYTAPTASGPVAVLKESDLIGNGTDPPVTIPRAPQVDSYSIEQVQFFDRNSDYAQSFVSEPLNGAIALFGPRTDQPNILPEIQDPAIARKILAIEVRRKNLLRNTPKFKMKANLFLLEAWDLITFDEPLLGISGTPVRFTSIAENDSYELECETEPYIWGLHSPDDLPVTSATPYLPTTGQDPGQVNDPIIFEPPARLSGQKNQGEIWLVVSGASSDYGGCLVLISTDGGASYNPVPGGGTILGNAVTGFTVGDWPIANDPDTTNDLSVDLTESLGTLASYAVSDEDNFVYPCYVAGGLTCVPYELMAYAVANLTAANKYTLKATGGGMNHLRRAVFAAPQVGVGVDHPTNSRFAFLSPSGIGIYKLPMDPLWIGKTLHFKFLAFNTFGDNPVAQADATDYTYTPTGCPAAQQNPNNNYVNTPAVSLSQTTPTNVAMAQTSVQFPSNKANYNARNFTIPDPGGTPTVYYVTIYDPAELGDEGTGTALTPFCETSNAKVGQPGYTYMGFIQATDPTTDPRNVAGPGGWPPPQTFLVGP